MRHCGFSSESSGSDMGYYRLYMLARLEGPFVGIEEIEAPDDVEAVRLSEAYAGAQALELWCGKRKVKSIPAREVEQVREPQAARR